MVKSSGRSVFRRTHISNDPRDGRSGGGAINAERSEGLAEEPEDADLTGSRRSLQRRLLGLNVADDPQRYRQAFEIAAGDEARSEEYIQSVEQSEIELQAARTDETSDSLETQETVGRKG